MELRLGLGIIGPREERIRTSKEFRNHEIGISFMKFYLVFLISRGNSLTVFDVDPQGDRDE